MTLSPIDNEEIVEFVEQMPGEYTIILSATKWDVLLFHREVRD
ncbi:MAG: hypothetical protein AB7T38_08995 [Nitrospirales bacterium]